MMVLWGAVFLAICLALNLVLWAVPLVLGSILGTTTLYIVMKSILRERHQMNPLEGVSPV